MDQGWVIFGAIVAALAGGLVYGIACAIYPFADCARCEGGGKIRSSSGRTFRRCRRCKGSGARVRFGRRVWKKLSNAKNAAIG